MAVVGGGSGSGDDFLRGSHLDYWYNASFDSLEDAFDYHYNTHVVQAGYSQTPEEYTSDALAFQQPVRWSLGADSLGRRDCRVVWECERG